MEYGCGEGWIKEDKEDEKQVGGWIWSMDMDEVNEAFIVGR